jgi:hypothetical protein
MGLRYIETLSQLTSQQNTEYELHLPSKVYNVYFNKSTLYLTTQPKYFLSEFSLAIWKQIIYVFKIISSI